MSDRNPQKPGGTGSGAEAGSPPPERIMRVAPLDLRQHRFRTAMRGFDKTEVVALLTEAADDYEQALRENDRLRQDLIRVEALLQEHRDREANLRDTLLTAQRLADDMRSAAEKEARLIVQEAQGRADLLVHGAQARLDDIERQVNEMRLRRRGVETSLDGTIQALNHALDFVREQVRAEQQTPAREAAHPAGAGLPDSGRHDLPRPAER